MVSQSTLVYIRILGMMTEYFIFKSDYVYNDLYSIRSKILINTIIFQKINFFRKLKLFCHRVTEIILFLTLSLEKFIPTAFSNHSQSQIRKDKYGT